MARYQQQTKARALREDSVKIPDSIPSTHRVCFVALLDALVHAGMGFYAGSWTRGGRIKLRVYTADEQLETFLDVTDNPEEWLAEAASSFFSASMAAEVCRTIQRKASSAGPRAPGQA